MAHHFYSKDDKGNYNRVNLRDFLVYHHSWFMDKLREKLLPEYVTAASKEFLEMIDSIQEQIDELKNEVA